MKKLFLIFLLATIWAIHGQNQVLKQDYQISIRNHSDYPIDSIVIIDFNQKIYREKKLPVFMEKTIKLSLELVSGDPLQKEMFTNLNVFVFSNGYVHALMTDPVSFNTEKTKDQYEELEKILSENKEITKENFLAASLENTAMLTLTHIGLYCNSCKNKPLYPVRFKNNKQALQRLGFLKKTANGK